MQVGDKAPGGLLQGTEAPAVRCGGAASRPCSPTAAIVGLAVAVPESVAAACR